MKIRKACNDDFPVLFDYIEKLWSYNHYDESKIKLVFEKILMDTNSFIFILEDDGYKGFIHGCFMNTFWMSGETCYISSLYVNDLEREKGYGRNLIEYVKEYANSVSA